jgi:hypothetical protein
LRLIRSLFYCHCFQDVVGKTLINLIVKFSVISKYYIMIIFQFIREKWLYETYFLYSFKIKNLIKIKHNILDHEQVGRNNKRKSMVYNYFVLLVVIGISKQEKKDVNKNLNQVMKFQFSEIRRRTTTVWLIIKSNYLAFNHYIFSSK